MRVQVLSGRGDHDGDLAVLANMYANWQQIETMLSERFPDGDEEAQESKGELVEAFNTLVEGH